MLQNEPQAEQITPPGQKRITPEELSQAVAAIERRREADAKRISIDEAVSQLNLDATSEDIWHEVQAQREAADAERQKAAQAEAEQARLRAQKAQSSSSQTRVPAATFARGRRRRWPRVFLPLIIIGGVFHWTGAISHHHHAVQSSPPALTATASQIPDGTQFYCDNAGLIQLSEGKPLPQIHVSATQDFGNSWSLVKTGGHIYLHAYTLPLDSVQAIKGQSLVLYNDDNSGGLEGRKTAQTVVRIDKTPLAISGGDDDYTQITVPNFQPDPLTTTSEWK